MKVEDIITFYPMCQDETTVGLIVFNKETGLAEAQRAGYWYSDIILKYMDYTVQNAVYWHDENKILLKITKEA